MRASRINRRFFPGAEQLERLLLLAGDDIATFSGPYVMAGPTLAYALPGMKMVVAVNVDQNLNRTSLQYVKYTISNEESTDDANTHYDPNVGRESDGPRIITDTPQGNTLTDSTSFYAFKDPGDYTVDIEAKVNDRFPPGQTETLTEDLTVRVEAPTVSFHVQGNGPVSFGWADQNYFPLPGATSGAQFGWFTRQPNPNPAYGFDFQATVTNSTEYDVTVGFIQLVDYTGDLKFSNGQDFPFD